MSKPTKEGVLYLPLKPKEQNYVWNCGPTALYVALRFQFGLPLTLNELTFLTGATEAGSDEFNLIRALQLLGFKYRLRMDGTVGQLKKCLEYGQPPIVHIVVPDGEGHYVTVCGVDDENVKVADPTNGEEVTYGLPYFIGCWRVGKEEPPEHWYMVVTGHSGDKLAPMITKLKRIQRKIIKYRS
jgi:ABC-type bacteriocin/lantibiotic exporter with double-glycine peptidase domain